MHKGLYKGVGLAVIGAGSLLATGYTISILNKDSHSQKPEVVASENQTKTMQCQPLGVTVNDQYVAITARCNQDDTAGETFSVIASGMPLIGPISFARTIRRKAAIIGSVVNAHVQINSPLELTIQMTNDDSYPGGYILKRVVTYIGRERVYEFK